MYRKEESYFRQTDKCQEFARNYSLYLALIRAEMVFNGQVEAVRKQKTKKNLNRILCLINNFLQNFG